MRTNYIEILNNAVEIPIIQRDYAQGRTDNKTNKIRKDFLDVLFEFIQNKHSQNPTAEIELDFIYGFNEKDGAFIPIDGQQRITTLWLLYWVISRAEAVPDDEIKFLSNFLYETRHSTTEFCKRLLQFKPDVLNCTISKEIKNQAWYFDTWDYDASIQAMLVVLDDIRNRYKSLGIGSIWNVIGGGNCPFHFYKLDMEKVGLSDDLYIKMNSRGKALTEFEYFKAGFAELLTEPNQRARFEQAIDGKWIDAVWHIVHQPGFVKKEDDIALTVDNAFLNLFNYITSIISFKNGTKKENKYRYIDTVESPELLKTIYFDTENQNFLFDTLDAICAQLTNNPSFWDNTFYYKKEEFSSTKTRLYFQHCDVNLLKRSLIGFSEYRGFTLPEQILLLACLAHFKTPGENFEDRIRTVRNLVVNSENELRETILGHAFIETETYITTGDLSVFKSFNTEQAAEEKRKEIFISQSGGDKEALTRLEDSAILRGRVSILPLDAHFKTRADKFLELFEEEDMFTAFEDKCNLLLCFGDYSLKDGDLINLIAQNAAVTRSIFTTQGHQKSQAYTPTQQVVLDCLDYFISNPAITPAQKIQETLHHYSTSHKDWKYYFIKYRSFRKECTKGYYWHNGDYCIWKMRLKQFNGFHWDPFLYELRDLSKSGNLSLDNYRAKLLLTSQNQKLRISSLPNGFLFESESDADNSILNNLITNNIINSDRVLAIPQNGEGIDLNDRIEVIQKVLTSI